MAYTSLAQVDDLPESVPVLRLDGYDSDLSSIDEQDPFGRMTLVESSTPPEYGAIGKVTFELLDTPIELAQDLSGGCGGKIWEAAGVMVDYMLWKQNQTQGLFLQGKKVLELGSGTGLVGLAVAKGCANVDTMVITDQIPMMHLMSQNITLNKLDGRVQAKILDWGEPISSDIPVPDVILASDCVYLEVAYQPLIDTLVALSNKDTDIYMSYRKRRRANKRFFQMARKKFHLIEVTEDPKREQYTKDGLRLYLMKKKC
ncbi:hypothetical protein O0I10_005256 [Lichtheimia ornata]|uniref:Protein-lysine N-methyltransferase EFM6 n=1 Tax=Lichtheimia ornata TaxID=688661 RepID=A0AAD7V4S3_9FUNG|nr:uncharacterized protein O0I10_005256 [Lichtheimia ornata]KAJ8658874.1 hypothetical protein O0I10_005256 [Lichtheimia ornata]